MITRSRSTSVSPRSLARSLVVTLALAAGACSGGEPQPTQAPPPTGEAPAPSERPSLTSAECQEKGGEVVGDIGDGAIHRPDYRCASGSAPIGSIRAAEGEPIAVEGSVCCPKAS
ncbi:MAG: hypothetical protein KC420_02390 [Myxococcales bacterium]|nr:hypothetical protein [Myxococcales bacterium]